MINFGEFVDKKTEKPVKKHETIGKCYFEDQQILDLEKRFYESRRSLSPWDGELKHATVDNPRDFSLLTILKLDNPSSYIRKKKKFKRRRSSVKVIQPQQWSPFIANLNKKSTQNIKNYLGASFPKIPPIKLARIRLAPLFQRY